MEKRKSPPRIKKLTFEPLDEPTTPTPREPQIPNEELKDKTGKEILQMLQVDFVNSDIAKGISDLDICYVPDFGYKDILEFGEKKPDSSGWKVLLECIQKHPK